MVKSAKVMLANIAITLLLVVAFDTAAYFFLPDKYVTIFTDYRFLSPPEFAGRVTMWRTTVQHAAWISSQI